jgi:hypothetical protein
MKKVVFICIINIGIWSCGGSEDSGTTTPPKTTNPTTGTPNTAPTTPSLKFPTNGLLCISNTIDFQWEAATDSEKDAITYQIQIATDEQFTKNLKTLEGSNISQTISVDKGITYYWRVKAVDSKNLSGSFSTTFSFYTEGVAQANRIPFLPEISPIKMAQQTPIILGLISFSVKIEQKLLTTCFHNLLFSFKKSTGSTSII